MTRVRGAAVGDVIVFVPATLGPAGEDLLHALATVVPTSVILGITGDGDVDPRTHTLAARLEPTFGPHVVYGSVDIPRVEEVVSCPDVAEESAAAVHAVVARLERGVPLHRMAIVSSGIESARALHLRLAAAGVPSNGPGYLEAAERAAGRVLRALLTLAAEDFHRDALLALLSAAPIAERPGGGAVPAARWERIAGDAGVVAGARQWRALLQAHASRSGAAARDTPALTRRLAVFVAELARRATPPARAAWSERAKWTVGLLDRYLASERLTASWPAEEIEAFEVVRTRVERLGELDVLGTGCDHTLFSAAVAEELRAPAGRVGRFGLGVLVAPAAALRGLDLTFVAVTGMSERAARVRRRNPWLASHGDDLGVHHTAHDDLLAALAAAPERVALVPRLDRRRHREAGASPWVLGAGVVTVSSRWDSLRSTHVHASLAERDLAALVAWHDRTPDTAHPLVTIDAALATRPRRHPRTTIVGCLGVGGFRRPPARPAPRDDVGHRARAMGRVPVRALPA